MSERSRWRLEAGNDIVGERSRGRRLVPDRNPGFRPPVFKPDPRGPKMVKPQVVAVTGASAGVGRATVREFARQGAWIGLIARGLDGLEAARREVEALGGRALVICADVADAAQVEAAADRIEAELG